MQKVEGSNPFSRFQNSFDLQAFRSASRLVPLHRPGLIPDLPPADRRRLQENAVLQADSGSSEPKFFCEFAEGRVFCLLRPLAGSA
jgi:hypothetical protein